MVDMAHDGDDRFAQFHKTGKIDGVFKGFSFAQSFYSGIGLSSIMDDCITEGKATICASDGKVDHKMEVFYNPAMKPNRDISVLVLNALGEKDLQIALPLSASGIRGIRYAKELKPGIVKSIAMNDHSEQAVELMKRNAEANGVTADFSTLDATDFLLQSNGFDVIDLDPFGTPNPFLDASVKRLSRRGILAITATDTAPLSGTYPEACLRKYWAKPLRNHLMHEIGIRILIRKVQLVAAQYGKAIVPVYCFSREHYFRLFLRNIAGKTKADEVLAQHGMFADAGPLWLGQLWDADLAQKVALDNCFPEHQTFLAEIASESMIPVVGFHDVHTLVRDNGLNRIPRKEHILAELREKGILGSETHFLKTGIRTQMKEADFVELIRSPF
jgi:tRNA (guanine26-N2/guanine27-N2)-dimethyltransferase